MMDESLRPRNESPFLLLFFHGLRSSMTKSISQGLDGWMSEPIDPPEIILISVKHRILYSAKSTWN